MSSKYVFFITFLFLTTVAVSKEARKTQKEEPPKQKAIETKTLEAGEKSVAGEISYTRSEFIYPSIWGTAGIFRVRSGESLPEGALTFGIGGEFYTTPYGPDFGTGVNQVSTIAESLFLGYSPLEHLTLGVMRRNSSTTYNLAGQAPQLISSLGDFNFTTQYEIPIGNSFFVAPLVNLLVASNFNSLTPAVSTISGGAGAAVTYSFYPTFNLPLYLHGNLIYNAPQIRNSGSASISAETFYNFSRFNTVTLGLGAEMKLGSWIPFLEYHETVEIDSLLSLATSPSRITAGTRLSPFENKGLSILLGADIGLGRGLVAGVPYNPSYQIIGQLSYTFGLSQSERKHYFTTTDVNVVNRKFVIRKNIQFKVGSSELETQSMGILDQIARVILDNKVKKLLIVGHTDSSHNDDFNLKLSIDRANTVKNYLVGKGIAEETLMAQGYGRRKPRASNLTEGGRMQNRRVEFFILE